MSLPTNKPAQLSIRSFFQATPPKYAPPPGSVAPALSNSAVIRPPPPPPPPQTDAPELDDSAPSEQQQVDQQLLADSLPPLPASLPREANIRPVTAADVNAVRRINALLLPVSYPESFYKRAVDPATSGRFSRVITWAHDGAEPKVVGGVVCRIEPDMAVQSHVPQNLYIQSLCLLAPYRSMGLINAAVDHIIATAVADSSLHVSSITAHVWTENDDALRWYLNRGFEREGDAIDGYYFKLRPDAAWLIRRPVGASVRNMLPTTSSPSAVASAPLPVRASTTAALVNLPPTSKSGPPKASTASRPPMRSAGQSFQNQRPETEWNDLPDDMASLAPPRGGPSDHSSNASSRSSSTGRKKRDRAYPAAAFGK